jgi:hypothetical protein
LSVGPSSPLHPFIRANYGAGYAAVRPPLLPPQPVSTDFTPVSCVQALIYYTCYPRDLWYIKSLVGAVFVFDTVHQILISHTREFFFPSFFILVLTGVGLIYSVLVHYYELREAARFGKPQLARIYLLLIGCC